MGVPSSIVTPEAQALADNILALYPKSEIKKALAELRVSPKELRKYRDDPAGFGIEVLNEYYTPDIVRVMESVRDNRITIARSSNQIGKSHCAARLALWFLLMWDDSRVYTTSAPPEENLKRILWGEIGSLIGKRPDLVSNFKVRTMLVERSPDSFLTGVAIPTTGTKEERQAKWSGKHAPHQFIIVDEGDAVPDEVYLGIESCMSGAHVRLLIMFNPRRRSGTVWRMERDGEANIVELSAFNHPNVLYGEDRVPGAVDRETTVRRINEWTRPLVEGERPSEKCFEIPPFLVGTTAKSPQSSEYPPLPAGWREVINPAFWYMVLGLYPQQDENQLISQEWINNARVRWDTYVAANGMVPPEGVRPLQGVDVGEFGPDPNVSCFRYGGWVDRFVVWNGQDTDAVADRSLELYRAKNCLRAYVDATGYGSNVAPKMRRNNANAIGVKVGEGPTTRPADMDADFLQLRDQLWWSCREWLRTDPGAMLPPDEMLIEELLAPTYSYHGTKRKLKIMDKNTMKDILKRSPDRADSLCLTFAPTGGWTVGVAQIGR